MAEIDPEMEAIQIAEAEARRLHNEAVQLKANPVYKMIFSEVENDIFDALRSVPLGEQRELRDELVLSLQVLDRLKDQIEDKVRGIINTQS